MQAGGCAKFTRRTPCAVEPFGGARFRYLAANVVQADGTTIFPATGIKTFGPITIGFIGMTLKGTGNLVTPSGVKGLGFADEAATANALVPQLKAEGADAIVLLIHQGGKPAAVHDRQWLRRPLRRHPADPAQARSGDHDGRLRPHALGLCLQRHRRDGRRAPADQRRASTAISSPTSA